MFSLLWEQHRQAPWDANGQVRMTLIRQPDMLAFAIEEMAAYPCELGQSLLLRCQCRVPESSPAVLLLPRPGC